jgi:hypothetical protein
LYAKRGWKWSDKGLGEKWHSKAEESAVKLLRYNPLAEVIETIDFIFGPWGGYLPPSVTNRQGGSLLKNKHGKELTHENLKVTRLELLYQGYDSIREHMLNPDITAGPEHDMAAAKPKPSGGKPQQSHIDELVADFTEFRSHLGDRNSAEARLANWAKTFRIMLGKYPFEDIKAVIAAIRGCPEYVDQRRYHSAYDLNRPGEWERLQGYVQIYELIKAKKAAQPAVVPSPPKADEGGWFDEYGDWRPNPRPGPRRTSTDFCSPEAIEARRARYREGVQQRLSKAEAASGVGDAEVASLPAFRAGVGPSTYPGVSCRHETLMFDSSLTLCDGCEG